jgi:hypothetical protein
MHCTNCRSMERDEVFKEKYVNRSVPFYEEIQRMIAELAADHARDNSNIYDLPGVPFFYSWKLTPPNIMNGTSSVLKNSLELSFSKFFPLQKKRNPLAAS